MTFDEIFRNTFKAIGREIGLDVKVIDGDICCTPLDPNDPRYNVDYKYPSMPMIQACRADDFEFFHPLIEAGVLATEQMRHAAERYYLGKTKSGCPIFWMIDNMLTPMDARIGDTWMSTKLKARHEILKYWRVKHCLFGEHLLNTPLLSRRGQGWSDQTHISIVESEASAVILSELLPETIWMAYVYTCNLSPNLLAPLQGRQVTIYPRTDPTMSTYIFFLDYAQLVRSHYNIDLRIDSTLEYNATAEQKERCIDLLDFILES